MPRRLRPAGQGRLLLQRGHLLQALGQGAGGLHHGPRAGVHREGGDPRRLGHGGGVGVGVGPRREAPLAAEGAARQDVLLLDVGALLDPLANVTGPVLLRT